MGWSWHCQWYTINGSTFHIRLANQVPSRERKTDIFSSEKNIVSVGKKQNWFNEIFVFMVFCCCQIKQNRIVQRNSHATTNEAIRVDIFQCNFNGTERRKNVEIFFYAHFCMTQACLHLKRLLIVVEFIVWLCNIFVLLSNKKKHCKKKWKEVRKTKQDRWPQRSIETCYWAQTKNLISSQ